MPVFLPYLLKLSLSLSIVYLFYRLVLQKHTFYNWNRWYLLVYTFLSFLIPFINITPTLEDHQLSGNQMVQFIPTVEYYTVHFQQAITQPSAAHWDEWDWIIAALLTGTILLLIRLLIRYISFLNIRRQAKLIISDGMKIYQVDKDIIPFSFGNSIFINQQLHNETELKEIIRHEFVHVKQNHTHDILWGELLCIVNWYNPFAWLLRKAIRQNLEFIADNKVLQSGLDRKQYQYLLLKVIGNNHFSIANQFNFSSLKKRIAMMNKMRSARAHLFKFLFLLPLIAVMLLAFRNRDQQKAASAVAPARINQTFVDTPDYPLNEKGYFVHMRGNDRTKDYRVIVTDKNGKEIEIPMKQWKEKQSYYENLYGEILWPAAPPAPPAPASPPSPPAPPAPKRLPDNVESVSVNNNKAVVKFRNGDVQDYNLDNPKDKIAFEKKFGVPPTPPVPVNPDARPSEMNVAPPVPTVSSDGLPTSPVPPAPPKTSLQSVVPVPPVTPAVPKSSLHSVPPVPPKPPGTPQAGKLKVSAEDIVEGSTSVAASGEFTLIADSIAWRGSDGHLYAKGSLQQDGKQSGNMTMEGTAMSMNKSGKSNPLLVIDGRKASYLKDYAATKVKYNIKSLTKEEAIKIYGADGRHGALVITSIQ